MKKTTKADRIYTAVFDVIMDLRVALSRQGLSEKMDAQIAQAMDKAGSAAVAEYKRPARVRKGS